MSDREEIDDYQWLTGPAAAELLDQVRRRQEPLHTQVTWLRKRVSADRAHRILQLLELRERGRVKFLDADQMFFTPQLLEQATDQRVAAYKARRFAACEIVADLCCGIGGDLLSLAGVAEVRGVDRDPVAVELARANAKQVLQGRTVFPVTIECADVRDWSPADATAWHLDPDRRTGPRRSSQPAISSPNLDSIERLLVACGTAAIKLAPAAQLPDGWAPACECEWISCRRACRQLVAWHGALATQPGSRRATVLDRSSLTAGDRASSTPLATFVGQPDRFVPSAEAPARYLFDPDPAVVAARLTGALAQEHGLHGLSSETAYLTGAAPLHDPLLSCFELEDVMPFDERRLATYFAERKIGELEIKKRGVDVDPAALRNRLKLDGPQQRTLILAPMAGRNLAIVACRVPRG